MKTKQLEKIADALVATTMQYTDVYCEAEKTDQLDKRLWGALHLGFIAGMLYAGTSEEDMEQALKMAQMKLLDIFHPKTV